MEYYNKYLEYKIKYNNLKKRLLEKKKSNNILIGGNNKNKLYLFKAEWCGHCKAFKNTWNLLQKDKDMIEKVNFITYDSNEHKNEMKKYNIQGFPTILFVQNNKIIEYNGQRDLNNLKNFINQYTNN